MPEKYFYNYYGNRGQELTGAAAFTHHGKSGIISWGGRVLIEPKDLPQGQKFGVISYRQFCVMDEKREIVGDIIYTSPY